MRFRGPSLVILALLCAGCPPNLQPNTPASYAPREPGNMPLCSLEAPMRAMVKVP